MFFGLMLFYFFFIYFKSTSLALKHTFIKAADVHSCEPEPEIKPEGNGTFS
jgi:hypothetical protein